MNFRSFPVYSQLSTFQHAFRSEKQSKAKNILLQILKCIFNNTINIIKLRILVSYNFICNIGDEDNLKFTRKFNFIR